MAEMKNKVIMNIANAFFTLVIIFKYKKKGPGRDSNSGQGISAAFRGKALFQRASTVPYVTATPPGPYCGITF